MLSAALGRTFRLLAVGSIAGMILGVLATRVFSSIVYQATPKDPVILGGGQVWRKQNDHATIVDVYPGASLTIPLGTQFQFRSLGSEPLRVIGVTMPPWPGDTEASFVKGAWKPTEP